MAPLLRGRRASQASTAIVRHASRPPSASEARGARPRSTQGFHEKGKTGPRGAPFRVAWFYELKSATRLAPFGVPQPVARSYPATAALPLVVPTSWLLPTVMSWKSFAYVVGFSANP